MRPPLAIDRKEVVFWRSSKTSGCEMSPAFLSIDQDSTHCSTLSHRARSVLASECSGLQLPCDHNARSVPVSWPSPGRLLQTSSAPSLRLCLRRAPPANLPKAVCTPSQPPFAPRSALASLLVSLLESPSPASRRCHLGRFKSGFVAFASFLFRIRLALDVDSASNTSSAPTDNQ